REERRHPEAAAAVGKQRELRRFEVAHAGRVCGQVAHAGNEIAECETPVACLAEPGVRLVHMFFPDAHIAAVAMNQLEPEGAAEQVADGDTATAAGECGG